MENIMNDKSFSKEKCHKKNRLFLRRRGRKGHCLCAEGTLSSAVINQEYIIKSVETNNDDIKNFLFTLGCYEGERITLISKLSEQYIIVVKDARYSIDRELASCIMI